MQKFLAYNMTGAQPYDKSQTLKPEPNCNGFIVTNTGDTICTVNGIVLYPGVPGTSNGDSYSFGGNQGEVYLGTINIKFTPGGANPEVTVNQKFYITEKL